SLSPRATAASPSLGVPREPPAAGVVAPPAAPCGRAASCSTPATAGVASQTPAAAAVQAARCAAGPARRSSPEPATAGVASQTPAAAAVQAAPWPVANSGAAEP